MVGEYMQVGQESLASLVEQRSRLKVRGSCRFFVDTRLCRISVSRVVRDVSPGVQSHFVLTSLY